MKKNLEIFEFENKATNTEPPTIYTKFKTSEGWMSCFNLKANEEIKKYKGKGLCCVGVVEVESKDGRRVFKNIIECFGAPQEGAGGVDLKVGEEPVEVIKIPGIPVKEANNKHATMYVSYAKDVFCALPDGDDITLDKKMNLAISLVKQAKEAFE